MAESSGVRVLYVGGLPRSGTTLLDRMLGQLPGHCAVGELADQMWERGVLLDWPCGCGKPTSGCEFWTEVGRKAFGGWHAVDPDGVIALRRSVDRTHNIPLMLVPALFPSFHRRLDGYIDLLTRLYAAVAEVSGARIVVDSSKNASTLYALRRARGIDLRVALLTRDPRGVAYSLSKKEKVRVVEASGRVQYMPSWSPHTTARRWVTTNALIEALQLLGIPVTSVRYEDLVRDPLPQLERIEALLGEQLPSGGPEFLQGREVRLIPAHIVSSNPNRFNDGPVTLKPDEAWRQALPATQRRIVEAVTWPLRGRLGYPTR